MLGVFCVGGVFLLAGSAVVAGRLWMLVVGIRYRRGPPTVRNMRAVLKKASSGTRRIFRGIRCKKQAFPVRRRYSVPEAPFSGTGQARCPENSLVMHGAQFIKRRSVQGWASCHPREQGQPPGDMSGKTRPGNTAEKHGLNTWEYD